MAPVHPATLALAVATLASLAPVAACDAIRHRGDLPALDGFEGELDFAAAGTFAKGSPSPVVVPVLVRADKLRFDPPAPEDNAGGSFLIDSPGKRFFVLNAARKQAILFDLTADHGKPPGPHPVLRTGRKASVAGFACEEWEVSPDAEQKRETVCVAEKSATFFAVPVSNGMLATRGWLAEVFDGHHFPLRLVTFDKTGAEIGRLELIKIERMPEDPTQFSVPESFQTIDLAQLMQGRGALHEGSPPMPEPQLKLQARPSHS